MLQQTMSLITLHPLIQQKFLQRSSFTSSHISKQTSVGLVPWWVAQPRFSSPSMLSSGNVQSCQTVRHQVVILPFSLESKRGSSTGLQVGGGRPRRETGSKLDQGLRDLLPTTWKFWRTWDCLQKPLMCLVSHLVILILQKFKLIEYLYTSRGNQVGCS